MEVIRPEEETFYQVFKLTATTPYGMILLAEAIAAVGFCTIGPYLKGILYSGLSNPASSSSWVGANVEFPMFDRITSQTFADPVAQSERGKKSVESIRLKIANGTGTWNFNSKKNSTQTYEGLLAGAYRTTFTCAPGGKGPMFRLMGSKGCPLMRAHCEAQSGFPRIFWSKASEC